MTFHLDKLSFCDILPTSCIANELALPHTESWETAEKHALRKGEGLPLRRRKKIKGGGRRPPASSSMTTPTLPLYKRKIKRGLRPEMANTGSRFYLPTKKCIIIGCFRKTSPLADFLCVWHRLFENTASCGNLNCNKLYTLSYVGKRCLHAWYGRNRSASQEMIKAA